MKEAKYTGKITDAELDALKAKNGEVFEITIPVDDEQKEYSVGYLKKPARNIIGVVSGIAASNPLKASEIMLENCWLAGDERIKTDDQLFMSASELLGQLMIIRHGEIKKK